MKDTYKNLAIFHFADLIKANHSDKHLKGLIFGNFGAMNFGDEAILAGELGELAKIPNTQITVATRAPEEVDQLHSVKTVAMYDIGKVIQTIRDADFVIVGGGGLISKVERGIIGFVYQIYMLMMFFLLPLLFRKKIYVLGIGIYRNANPLIIQLSVFLLKAAKIVTVRDEHSYKLLQEKGVDAKLYKDNSFLMPLLSVAEVAKHPKFHEAEKNTKMQVGISLVRPDKPADVKRLSHEIGTFIINNHKVADFWFYASDYHPEYFNDEKFAAQIKRAVEKQSNQPVVIHLVPTNLPPQIFFSSLKLMDFVIAMRLHISIFSYRNNRNFLGVSYDRKCTDFLQSIGKSSTPYQQLTAKLLQTEFDKIR